MIELRFVSDNRFKHEEAKTILDPMGIHVLPLAIKIAELQTENTKQLVQDKTLKAFKAVGRSLFVEHTGLYLNHINGLPGGLTQIVWDTLQADKFSELFGNVTDPGAIARTVIGFTDARRFYFFEGEIKGRIAQQPRGTRDFQWDCVFIPDGFDQTFAEMGEKKHNISMRRRALDAFANFLSRKHGNKS
jgi:XTP/dITP diphosphohydrolase